MSTPKVLDVDLTFSDGRFVGVTLSGLGRVDFFPLQQLTTRGLLSITDRMILDQLAARVDKLGRQLAAERATT